MTTATAFAGAPAARRREAVIAGVIGNTLEWYDFAVYGYFVATISKLFFPSSDELVDNVLVSRDGFCDAGAKVYAVGTNDGPVDLACLRRHDRLSAHPS